MRATLWVIAITTLVGVGGLGVVRDSQQQDRGPQYAGKNELVRPTDYREWIYLSSGLGMNYGGRQDEPKFTNVFVTPSSYREFLAKGAWPDKTVFVVEERSSTSQGSINKSGRFQTDLDGIGVEVKDESRFPERWAYFQFGRDTKTSPVLPKNACWECHNQHAAVEQTFVQFYPTLIPVARRFGTYRQ
jgi:hypothetical protein